MRDHESTKTQLRTSTCLKGGRRWMRGRKVVYLCKVHCVSVVSGSCKVLRLGESGAESVSIAIIISAVI